METIIPSKHSIRTCLSNKEYSIDFYQREYVWSKETVEILLKDIFDAFTPSYEQYKDSDTSAKIIEQYNWYYLNVFITNKVDATVYIVDGQQRLTTLTLIAICLYKLTNDENLRDALKNCIYANSGWGQKWVIDHERRKDIMDSIWNDKDLSRPYKNTTEETIAARYKDIKIFIESKKLDGKKLEAFIHYFLDRLAIVELGILKDDTPMVFEVINDRGEALKSFEILKGKMVGALDKIESDKYSVKWDDAMGKIKGMEDDFFIDYIKARYLRTKTNEVEIELNNRYHRYIFEKNDIANKLGFGASDKDRKEHIKKFILQDLSYYGTLYGKIRKNCISENGKEKQDNHLYYLNALLNFNGQYQIILSACSYEDSEEDLKIKTIAKEFERLFILLVLNGIYSSNDLKKITTDLNAEIAGKSVTEYRSLFNDILSKKIREKRSVETIDSVLEYKYFSQNGYANTDISQLRYYFARVEQFLCEASKVQMQNPIKDIATKRGQKTGYHIEHILSHNATNKGYFSSEEEFENKRNLLGGLLLLKGADNISSSNEEFSDKKKTYSVGLLWGHTLCDDFYHTNKDFEAFNKKLGTDTGVQFQSYEQFDKDALEERTKLLYTLTKIIWEVE